MTISAELAYDDLGYPVRSPRPARRVVSLVPSLTESVALTRPEALVGATIWCTHPPDLPVRRVRGTKNPDLRAIAGLRPDIVLANKEENRRADVERLRAAGIPVWVTVIQALGEAVASLRRTFGVALGWPEPPWLAQAAEAWREPPSGRARAVIPVWRDPWIVVGSNTFTGDVAARLGLENVYRHHVERYPHVDFDDLAASRPDLIVLPDEPYPFGPGDGPDMFPGQRVALVEGRSLTWYGPSLVTARAQLLARLAEARIPPGLPQPARPRPRRVPKPLRELMRALRAMAGVRTPTFWKAPAMTAEGKAPPDHGVDPDAGLVSDVAVIRLSLSDSELFAELFHRHAPRIQRYVVRRLGQDAADDIVAETFLLAFRQRAAYDQTREDALPWLYGIATNLIGRHRRAETRLYRALARTGTDPVTAPFTDLADDRVTAGAASRRLALALAGLSAAYRDTLLLVVWGDLSYEEAAAALGVPTGTVRSRVNRARAALRRQLGDLAPSSSEEI